MYRVTVFGKQNCALCRTTKNKLEHFLKRWQLDHEVEMVFCDLETVDGRAEGAFYDVNQIPVTIVEFDGRPVARWDGQVPNSEDVRSVLEGIQRAAG